MKTILDLIDAMSEWTGRIVAWTILIMVGFVILEVLLRRFFSRPTIWSFEVTVHLYAFYFMILAGHALLHNSHVSVDVFYSTFGERTKAFVDVLTYLIFFFPFVSILLYFGIKYAASSWAIKETSGSVFSPPLYPLKTVIPVAALMLLLQGLAIFIRRLNIAIRGKTYGRS